ncbi:MAG: hypothetical protein L3J83_07965 [Proteobacteria bacterium]|nr:hypothetical protein [Pseudomonadota bacterium]
MEKHKGKYSSKSRRLKGWNYGGSGYYFITICTKNHKCFFGKIIKDSMRLSKEGLTAEQYLIEISQHSPFVELNNFVVMPNHVHAILIMNVDAINRASTRVAKNTGGFAGNNNPMLNNNISKIVRWYKGRVTFEIRKTNPNFSWQTNYHDHIIRHEKSYLEISEYINNNPLKWSLDRFNPINEKTL